MTKTIRLAAAILLFAPSLFAQGTASGAIHVIADDGLKKSIEFSARAKGDGAGDGSMSFSGAVDISDQDEDSNNKDSPTGLLPNVQMKADFDCVVVRDNRAAMTGIVRESSVSAWVGRRMLLAVEDGGEGSKDPADRFLVRMYRSQRIDWFPTDAEDRSDTGWKLSWIATDAERKDDVGVMMSHDVDVDCQTWPLGAHEMFELPKGSGNIQVKP